MTTAEEVSLNKPSPQIFLLTAEKLGMLSLMNGLVFEDSSAGIGCGQLVLYGGCGCGEEAGRIGRISRKPIK